MNKAFRKNLGLILIITLFLSLYLFYINPNADVWWDSAVYIGMGEYIYSFGEIGLYEDSRPLIWPLMLGFVWKLGLDAVFFGKLLILLFGVGITTLTYLIAYELFNKKIALISALLLSLSPTFFLFNSIMFTEIPSTFFVVLGLYLFIKKHYSLSGLFFGIGFMTRFFQISVIIPIYLFFIYLIYKKKSTFKEFFSSIFFFLIPLVPYLILNVILYNNPFHSFLLQAWMTEFTGWVFHQPSNFYFLNIIGENVLVLFSILGVFLILRNEKFSKSIIPLVFLLAFIPYNFVLHKEMRLLLPIFPLLYMLTGYGIIKFLDSFKKYKSILLLLILVIGVFQIVPKLRLNDYDDKLDPFYSFVRNVEIKKGIWISNPSFIVKTGLKADELIYYPLYDTDKIMELQKNVDNAENILINTCDILPCPPEEDSCDQEHSNFIDSLKEEFEISYFEVVGECEHYIFTRYS